MQSTKFPMRVSKITEAEMHISRNLQIIFSKPKANIFTSKLKIYILMRKFDPSDNNIVLNVFVISVVSQFQSFLAKKISNMFKFAVIALSKVGRIDAQGKHSSRIYTASRPKSNC